jgi:hypothetical protein
LADSLADSLVPADDRVGRGTSRRTNDPVSGAAKRMVEATIDALICEWI